MSSQIRVHLVISGMVQGVGFRWFIIKAAQELGLAGWTKNLPSGQVEIEAEGERGLIEILIKEIKIGPRMSHVTDITVDWAEYRAEYNSFDVRY